jgi:uncharacterized protein
MLKHFHRGLWIAAGLFFVLLAVIGLLLPVIPQLPFLIAAVLCFMRSSTRFREWIEKRAWFVRIRTRFQKFHPPHP